LRVGHWQVDREVYGADVREARGLQVRRDLKLASGRPPGARDANWPQRPFHAFQRPWSSHGPGVVSATLAPGRRTRRSLARTRSRSVTR
jgi:hypothetical protein